METQEYDIMFRVEDRHWWYRGLRAILLQNWRWFMSDAHPQLLDIGCGTGANMAAFRELSHPVGTDFSRHALGLCQARIREASSDQLPVCIPLSVGSAVALPFCDSSFQAVVTLDVLCHKSIKDKSLALNEVNRILKPGGLLFLNLPAYQWLLSSHDVHVHTDKRFTAREVVRILRACSFEPLHVTYWNTLFFPALAAIRIVRKLAPPGRSDLETLSGPLVNAVCGTALALERWLMRFTRMPFGLSVFAVARKPAS